MKVTKDDGTVPLGETFSLEEWEPALPPSDFAERVLARVKADGPEKTAKRASRRWGMVAAGAGILAVAAAMSLRVSAPTAQGEAIAQERIEVPLGSRALAVLEPGANVRWNGDDVVQSRGDVFYRVEPGKRFVVHTPAGDVEVRGTCFAVKVRGTEMQKRDVKAGTIGAALSALAFIAVYEGKVAVSHASGRVDLRAGESAQSGADGVKRLGPDGEKAFEASAATAAENDDPLDRANRNLVKQVGEYRSRLESVVAEKSELEAKLKRSEEQLAAGRDGSAPWKSEFDLSNDDWKELAKDGTIKYKMPCESSRAKEVYTAERLSAAGLTPEEGAALKDAHARSNERVWSELKPLCARAVGSADVAEKIGVNTCIHLVLDIENARDGAATMEARKLVGEIRAGLKPMPRSEDNSNPVLKLFLATTGEMPKFERDLAQTFGPEEAHRIAYSDELCAGQSTFGGTAKR